MSSLQRRLLATMGRTASSYGRVGPDFFAGIADGLIARVEVPPEARVPDVATGPGTLLSRLGRSDAALVGVDLSAPMVDDARERLRLAGRPDAEIHLMDAERLEFPGASFDCVFCAAALYQMPSPERADRALERFERDFPEALDLAREADGVLHWRPEIAYAVGREPRLHS